MTTRDRLMLVGMLALAILVGGYIMVVSPERKQATKLSGEVASARQQLQSAEAQAAEASSSRTRYAAAYASLVGLGPAVPASGETPSLLYALASATHNRNVKFQSIQSGGGAGGPSGAATPAASAAGASPAGAASAAFSQQPFSFVFTGSFADLYQLLHQLEGFTTQTTAGGLHVSGRLLTIDGVQFANAGTEGAAGAAKGQKNELKATVTATAYVLPPGQSALGGASPSAPAGVAPAASSAGGSSPTATAVVRGGP
jgi:type II secretion system (T2SS) protein M